MYPSLKTAPESQVHFFKLNFLAKVKLRARRLKRLVIKPLQGLEVVF